MSENNEIEVADSIYFKQIKMFDPSKVGNIPIHVYGVGSIGSHVVIGLAKLGFKNIVAYDYDIVEEGNLPAQFFGLESVGKSKLESLKSLVMSMTGIDVEIVEGVVDENFVPDFCNSIHISAFDSIEGRKLLIEKLENFPVHFLDGRIGEFNFEKYYVNCMDKDNVSKYKKSLEGTFSELGCGEKCLWIVNSLISSKIVMDCLKIAKGTFPVKSIQGNIEGDLILVEK